MESEIDERITNASAQIGYPKEALLFVLRGWPNFERCTHTHIAGATLCWRLHDYALHMYGRNAPKQLSEWGIRTTSDFGNIVFGMVEHGLLCATEADKLADFENVFDFEYQFLEPKRATGKPLRHWKLSTLFVVTTLSAIVISGFSRRGFDGVLLALFSSWFAFVGVSCMLIGITSRSRGWVFLVVFGIVCLAAGLFAFFNFSHW